MTPEERVDVCRQTREKASQAVLSVLKALSSPSEKEFAGALWSEVAKSQELHERGWYDPPPQGAAVLFASTNSLDRLLFDTLRKEKFWPSQDFKFTKDSVGFVYLSPVHRAAGIIGDFAVTIYNGSDRKIQNHIARCLALVEKVVAYAEVGMEFREIHDVAQKLLSEEKLSNARTLTYTDTVGTNIGHTIPWTYENPTLEEEEIIKNGDFETLKNLISKKRVNLNKEESFKIPNTIAFTVELRIEDPVDPAVPNIYFHLIVSFKNGVKNVVANFSEVFGEMGMDSYLISRHG